MIYPFPARVGISSSYSDHLRRTPPSSFPGTDYLTNWGTEVYAPFSGWLQQEDAKSFLGAVVASVTSSNGDKWYFLHLRDVVNSHRNVNEGDLIAHTGNSGLVSPKPTAQNPYLGSHCHVSAKSNRKFMDVEPLLATSPMKNQSVPTPKPSESDKLANELEEKYQKLIEALEQEKEATAGELATKQTEVEILKQKRLELETKVEKYLNTDITANLINQTSMTTAKDLGEKLVDGGKYIALAQPLGALLGLVLSKSLNVTGDEITIVVAGSTALVNILLIVLNHFVKLI